MTVVPNRSTIVEDTPTRAVCTLGICRGSRMIKGENRSAPRMIPALVAQDSRGLASRVVTTKGLLVKSIRTKNPPQHYRAVIASMGVCA
jgi:hypothetical protein